MSCQFHSNVWNRFKVNNKDTGKRHWHRSQGLRSRGTWGSSAPHRQSFLSMCSFFRRALEVPFLKEVTKNVHENKYANILFTLLLITFYQVENIKSIIYLTVSRMPWVEWTYHYQIVKLDVMLGRVWSRKFGQLIILAKMCCFFLKKREPKISPHPIQSLF